MDIVKRQREWFDKGYTKDIAVRRRALINLKKAIIKNESLILQALKADLHKSDTESFMCEIGLTLSEISYMLKNLGKLSRPKRVHTPLTHFHAKSYIVKEPYGSVLIISPWNYPFLLTMGPLVGAIAAGNCAVIKPSAYAPNTAKAMETIISKCFPKEYIAVVLGGREQNKALLDEKFDYMFFTGSVSVGKEVMKAASNNLIPVTLELGGKSPCIIDSSANLKLAAKRIAFGKILNCGQTCVAPDYVLIERNVKAEFITYLKQYMNKMCSNPKMDSAYVHMINDKHFDRVMGLIDPEKVVYGGGCDKNHRVIEPTIMDNVEAGDPIMQEEIFGPVLPILTFDDIKEAISFVNDRPTPLALYLFTGSKKVKEAVLKYVPFGGGCVNDTIMHLANNNLAFGGMGQSGMGSYHGKKSFETFTHNKSILETSTWMDLPVRYKPYNKLQDKLLRFFLR